MSRKANRLRVEFEFVPHRHNAETQSVIKELFAKLLRDLMQQGIINMRDHGASIAYVDTQPVEWTLAR